MIFLFVSAFKDSVAKTEVITVPGTNNNELITGLSNSTGDYLSVYSLRDVTCSINNVTNSTSGVVLSSGNYTLTNCLLKGTDTSAYLGLNVNASYGYTYHTTGTAYKAINDTETAGTTVITYLPLIILALIFSALIYLVFRMVTPFMSLGSGGSGITSV